MQKTLFTGIDSNFHSKFHSNEMLKMIKKAGQKYQNLTEEEKEKRCNKNLSDGKKQKLVEYSGSLNN